MALPPEKEKEKESQQSTDLREKPIEEMVFYPPRGNGRLLLPLSLTKDGPIYVNAKQYHGILRRRQSRAKEKLKNKGIKNRKRHTSTQPSPIEKHSSCDSHSSNCDTRAIWSPIRDSCPRYAGMQPLVVEKRSNCNSNCPVRDSCPSDTSTKKSLIEKCSNSNSDSPICDSFPKQQQLRDHLQSIEDKERCNGNAPIVEGSLIVKEEGNLQQELCDDLHRVEESFLAMDGSSIIKEEGDLVPYVGMEFKSPEEAHKFYVSYAMRVGFNTKVRNSHNKIIDGSKQLMLMSLSCDREGFKWDSREPVKKPRPHYRTGCKAEMRIKRIVRDVPTWVCHYVVLEHNHDLLPFMFHKNIGTSRTAKVIQMLAEEAGGFEKLTFRHMEVEKEVKCFIDLYERMNVKGDANAIQKHFSERHSKNPSFFYQMDIGKSGHLMNVFWVDGKCRASYSYFGDVVTFDTTYLTGKYDMPIAVFLGVNHHGQRICLGCGMLANETTETFVWLFKAWLKAMGQPPMSITTDQCPAIQEAIEVVFPEVHYRLSLWHIMKKQTVKFGEMENKEEVMSTMSKCVYDSFKVEDFEREWKDMIKTYDLERNEWLQSLYEIRELWVPAYQRGTIFTGLQATLQSESIDHFFDGFVHQKTTLSEFIEQYDRVLQEHYQKEIDADFADFHSIPILRMHHSFEVQGASFYTEEIFQKFQTQILKMDNCVIAVKDVDGAITMYVVTDTITKENGPVEQKGYKLTFDAWEAKVSCICCLFEFQGILCNHAMSVLYANGITQIPSHYMLQRWRKDFKRTHAIYSDCERDQVNQAMDRCNDLWRRCIQFANEAAVTTERYLFAVQVLAEATNKIRHMDRYFNAGKTIDPKQAKRRGRPPKQHLEAIRDEMTTETCGLCQKTGHTAATCHEMQCC